MAQWLEPLPCDQEDQAAFSGSMEIQGGFGTSLDFQY